MDTTPIDDHHDLCGGGAADGYPMREIRAQRGASPGGARGEQTWGRAIRDCADDAEPHAARDLAPGTIAPPGPACAAFVACALTLASGPGQQTSTLGYAPPAGPGEGPAPQEGCLCREQMVVPWWARYVKAARARAAEAKSARADRWDDRSFAQVFDDTSL